MDKKINYLFAFGVLGVTLIIMNIAGALLSLSAYSFGFLTGGNAGTAQSYAFLNEHINFYGILIYLVLLVFFGLWYYFEAVREKGTKRYIHDSLKNMKPVSFVWIFILAFGLHFAISIVLSVIAMLLPSFFQNYTELVEASGLSDYSVAWLFSTLILPPLAEEIIFRGLVFRYLRRAGAGFIVANVIQAVCFGIYHMNVVQGIYAAILGFLLGWLVYQYKSLAAPVFLHFLFNLFGTALTEFEYNVLPEFVQGIFILQGIPIVAAAVVLIHFHVGEKRRDGGEQK